MFRAYISHVESGVADSRACTFYAICVEPPPIGPMVVPSWTVRRRYSQFRAFYSALSNSHPTLAQNLPSLPSKSGNALSPVVIQTRQKRFSEMLDVLSGFSSWQDIACLMEFLRFDVHYLQYHLSQYCSENEIFCKYLCTDRGTRSIVPAAFTLPAHVAYSKVRHLEESNVIFYIPVETLVRVQESADDDYEFTLVIERETQQELTVWSRQRTVLIETLKAEMDRFTRIREDIVRFVARINIYPIDCENIFHWYALTGLYALLTDDESPIGRKDPRWQILGFQGQDPATDFRGMGAFGLGQLCYLALKYTGEAKAMVAEQPEYPVACSGLNISHFVLNRLRDKESDKEKDKGNQGKERETVLRLMTALCVTGEIGVENVLNEVYCALVMYLDYLFAKEQAGYMQYPAVLARVCSKLDAVAEAAVAGRQHAPVRTIDAFRVLLFSHLSTTSVTSI